MMFVGNLIKSNQFIFQELKFTTNENKKAQIRLARRYERLWLWTTKVVLVIGSALPRKESNKYFYFPNRMYQKTSFTFSLFCICFAMIMIVWLSLYL